MRVDVDWRGDGTRIGVFDVTHNPCAGGCGCETFVVVCAACGHVGTASYPEYKLRERRLELVAAVDGACDEPCRGAPAVLGSGR